MNKQSTQRHRLIVGWALFLGLVALDQASKHWVEETVQRLGSIVIIPGFFNLTYVRNTGIAFGLFGGNNLLWGVIAIGLLLVGLSICRQFNWRRWETILVGATLLAGAIGNLIDRFQRGYVPDFLDFNLGFYRWPSFNVADSAITLSILWILYRSLAPAKKVDA